MRESAQQMADTFRGEHVQKVDAKARVSIPAPFRTVLKASDPIKGGNPRVIIVYGGERSYVECYSIDHMARIERRIARMKSGSPERRYMERNLITLSQIVEIDGDGRFVLSPKVREKIGMTDLDSGDEALFAGTLQTFQIWRSADYGAPSNLVPASLVLQDGADMMTLLPDDDGDED
jgi:MraZ protein